MKQYIDSFAIANTVRMIGSLRGGARAALVEKDSDVMLIKELIDPHDKYYVIPALSRENLVGAMEILARDHWKIACIPVSGTERMTDDVAFSLQRFPWINVMSKGTVKDTRELTNDNVCLAVISADVHEPLEQSPSLKRRKATKGHQVVDTGKEWSDRNARRISLIKKQLRQGLTTEEQDDLNCLQYEMSKQLNDAYPLPFDALEKLEEYVNDAERRLVDKK